MKLLLAVGTALSLSLGLPTAHAGRPLGTDDASTAAAKTCQVEAWYEHVGSGLSAVVAPACGLTEELELDLDTTLPVQRQAQQMAGDLALKWAPAAWSNSTPLGELAFGLKGNLAFEHPAGAGWRRADSTGLLLASLQLNDQWALHLNLGRSHLRASGLQATLTNLAATWAPSERGLLFAEWCSNNRPTELGNTMHAAGGRWWLQKDKLGLDLTVGREATAGAVTQVTLGFGWYGLGF